MKNILYFLFALSILSCNHVSEVIDEVKSLRKQTITVSDYHYVLDKKNRRGYVTSDNEIMHGHYIVKKEDKPIEEFQIKNGFLNGLRIEFDDFGNISSERNYIFSYLDGPAYTYFPNGAIKSEAIYDFDKVVGDEVRYDLHGNTTYKKTLEDGVSYELYYDNGKRVVSRFKKNIDEVDYNLIVIHDSFENIEMSFGKITGEERGPDIYVFNANFKLIEKINANESPERAGFYVTTLRKLAREF